jgi:hypothetical protein
MNPDSQLLVGVVLIGAGILFALLAYTVLTNRPQAQDAGDEVEADEEAAAPTADVGADEFEDQPPPSDHEVEAVAPEPATFSETKPDEVEKPATPDLVAELPPATDTTGLHRAKIDVFSLLRDEVTGNLIVKVGDREYMSVAALRDSPDWTRVEYAASDLAKWFSGLLDLASYSKHEAEEATPKPKSMIEQINAILQQKLAESEGDIKAVQLIEGPGGTVRVRIGVQSYDIGEVPNEEIRQVIRQAVAAWEDR